MDAANRNPRRDIPAALLVGVVMLVAACASPAPAVSPVSPLAPPSGPFDLTVLHSNDTWGYLDPCG